MLETMTKLSELSEAQIIGAILAHLPGGDCTWLGSGDDCAQVGAPTGSFLVSTDMLVDSSHFRRDWSTPFEIGARAAAQNLADIAAMGARPSAMVVAMSLPADLSLEWLEDFARGLASRCRPLGVGVVGGDITRGSLLTIGVTVFGEVIGGRPVVRSGAQPGNIVALAGTLGFSAAGLALLSSGLVEHTFRGPSGVLPQILEPHRCEVTRALELFRAPQPPLAAGLAAGASAGTTALLDVSDGLVLDAHRLAKASGVNLVFSPQALEAYVLPLQPLAEVLGVQAWDWVLGGGEDHGLLGCFDPGFDLPEGFVPLGKVEAPDALGDASAGAPENSGKGPGIVKIPGRSFHSRGFQHFASS